MTTKFRALSRLGKIGVVSVGSILALGFIGATIGPSPQNSQTTAKPAAVLGTETRNNTQLAKHAPVIATKEVLATQAIPFTSTTVNSAALPKGTSKITTAGVDGVSTLTYRVTYSDGTETNRELVSTATTTQPVTQITTVGTYVTAAPQPSCPNGTYVNSVGNSVCSPYSSNSAPAGATAQCRDGSYSFSQSRSGTCSHHGGVSSWL